MRRVLSGDRSCRRCCKAVSAWLPLTHAIDLARPLVIGNVPDNIGLHIAGLLAYGSVGYVIALELTRRRLLK